MAKPGNESAELILGFRREKSNGRIGKRFRDEFYALDLIRVLYDDTVSPQVKLEVLIVLEEYAHIGITEESVDQVVSSLLDIYHQAVDRGARGQVMCQILSTCTSLLIQLDQLDTELSGSFVKELVHVVMSRVNQPGSERLRACACQSLMHIETFSPGMLSCHYEELAPLYQREKTYVFQDYSLLVAKILESLCSVQPKSPKSPTDKLYVQKQVSSDSAELRKTVSDLVENVAMLTRSGSFQITQSLASIVSQQPDIPAVIARPMMLHQVASMSCIVFHTVLYLQRVFNGEALTGSEEAELLHRLCNMTRHPCLNELHRLLAVHWVHGYKQRDIGKVELPEMVVRHHRLMFYPSVFDSVDCQLARLYITSLCSDTSSDTEGMETSILLGSLGCLHKLVWHTGSSQAARSLFRALYFIYTRHHNQHFSRDIQRFVRGLISEFAHFIPHSIDFVDSIHSLEVNSGMFVETLSLLHQQVVMATEEQMHESYTFYLQIMKKVSTQTQINQNCTLKFLYYLAQHAAEIDDSSWLLGHGILGICRNIIIHHGTQQYFPELSGLLFDLLTAYNHIDVQDRAKFYYCLITSASDTKVRQVLQTSASDVESLNQALTSILPGVSEKKSLANIVQLDHGDMLNWERVGVEVSCREREDKKTSCDQDQQDAIEKYENVLSTLELNVDLKCRLRLTDTGQFDILHAVSVTLEDCLHFEHIPKKHLPCIYKTGSREVVFQLKPRQPLPQVFPASVDFCDESKQTFSASLTPVAVKFCEMMIPLPWKPDNNNLMPEFFQGLWNRALKLTENGESSGIESVKQFEISSQQYCDASRKHLEPFLLGHKIDFSSSCYGILLPPGYHVLLRCKGQGQARSTLTVAMVMDRKSLLPHVDKFLKTIFASH